MPQSEIVTVIGAGLAGCEAAWQLAQRGIGVRLVEMRPTNTTPAHHGADLAELVCSNSLKSDDPTTAAGLLKRELEALGSLVMVVAKEWRIPAGTALAVDREHFSAGVTRALMEHPRVEIVREEADSLPPGPCIIATGPLTSSAFEPVLSGLVGEGRLAFYDAAAPIVEADSLDLDVVFAASRYERGEGADYLNAPLDREQYERFHSALVSAERVHAKDFETKELFAACQPVEEVGRTGVDSLRYGALKPVGLVDPATGTRPWAVVQLRAENAEKTAYNVVGFQTNLTFGEQERVFRLIPGLENAEFVRYGVMHRNTFIDSPRLLDPTLALRDQPRVRLAGQVTGTEGYLEAAGSGLLAGLNTYAALRGLGPVVLPKETALGALIGYATDPAIEEYQPMHVNFGIVPPLPSRVRGKRERYAAYSARARVALRKWLATRPDLAVPA
jgi:methylenetetrahydrofolate--tRNA-(uracil-5-)-methyltransferase